MVVVLIYVDDLLITSDDLSLIQETKHTLQSKFKIKDLGDLRYFLGIKFARSHEGILMHLRKYALELISNLGLSGAKPLEHLWKYIPSSLLLSLIIMLVLRPQLILFWLIPGNTNGSLGGYYI